VAGLFAQGLTYLDADFKPQPQLATSWDISTDGLTYTYHLREGVTWSDGEPFTSADVVWTLTQGIGGLANARLALTNAKVTALDDHTVEIVLPQPSSILQTVLSKAVVKILPEHIYAGTDMATNPANVAPISTGPFTFEKWDKGKSISFVRNESYWGDAPYLDGITVSLLSDATTAVNALRTGEIDYYSQVPDASVVQAEADDALTVSDAAGVLPPQAFLAFNTKTGPTADVKVRRAIAQAIDRNQWVEAIYAKEGKPGVGPITPVFADKYDSKNTYDSVYPLNIAAANKALDAAGYPKDANGTRFTVNFRSGADSQAVASGELLKSQLAAIGIAVNINPVSNAALTSEIFMKFQFDMYFQTYFDIDPVFLLNRQYGSKSVGLPFANLTQYSNPTVDAAIADLLVATDKKDYDAAITTATKQIIDDLPYLVVANPANQQAWRSEIQGIGDFKKTSAYWPDWSKVWIAQ
jgi:peptide/nickel transport system substrate-binding protein